MSGMMRKPKASFIAPMATNKQTNVWGLNEGQFLAERPLIAIRKK